MKIASNKALLGTRHKVSGPQNADVGRSKYDIEKADIDPRGIPIRLCYPECLRVERALPIRTPPDPKRPPPLH